jgi:hypothetical protein
MAATRPPAYVEPAGYVEPSAAEVIDLRDRPEQHTPESDQHRLEVVEVGSFARARCGCGWDGPARRSRAVAVADGERHQP